MSDYEFLGATYGQQVHYCSRLLELNLSRATKLDELTDDSLIAISLHIIYRISTCEDHCLGGGHVIERLVGRVFNSGSAALTLISMGYYDEALNLCRSMGEIANLLALFAVDPTAGNEWLNSSRKTRTQKFSPMAVRIAIESQSALGPPVDAELYRELCEAATHPTPQTAPNKFGKRAHVGPFQQETGKVRCLNELSNLLPYVAMVGARLTENEEAFELLASRKTN
ncbi:hypothetical protein AB3Y40_14755 [Yoonia sp. R2331]|uniref:hypothetical protein n=1 Tax=Yoonia sp. R2331 TaxID=3237238 RepID=UPI0034E5A037